MLREQHDYSIAAVGEVCLYGPCYITVVAVEVILCECSQPSGMSSRHSNDTSYLDRAAVT